MSKSHGGTQALAVAREPACLGSELRWGRDRSCWASSPPCAHGVCTVCEQVMEMEPGEGVSQWPSCGPAEAWSFLKKSRRMCLSRWLGRPHLPKVGRQ